MRNSRLILGAIAISALILQGCASTDKPMDASVYLLSTNKGMTVLLNELAEDLKANKYQIKKVDTVVGLLVTEPRKFPVARGEDKTYAEQLIQIRQEGGSLKLRFTYKCQNGDTYKPCGQSDQELRAKVARVERAIIKLFNKRLFKSPADRPEGKEI